MALAWLGCVNVAALRWLRGCRPFSAFLGRGRLMGDNRAEALAVHKSSRNGSCDAIETFRSQCAFVGNDMIENDKCSRRCGSYRQISKVIATDVTAETSRRWTTPSKYINFRIIPTLLSISINFQTKNSKAKLRLCNQLIMATIMQPRTMFSQCVRCALRAKRIQAPRLARRPMSSKHPKGFVAPAKQDLEELRERVQEFTSTLSSNMYTPSLQLTER